MLLVKRHVSVVCAKTPALQYLSISFCAVTLYFSGMGTYFAYKMGGSGSVRGA
jgi:hypothetical protein